ncbi:MAG: Asp23/Gls24 family envelope stress response protein [Mycetocola sp.]
MADKTTADVRSNTPRVDRAPSTPAPESTGAGKTIIDDAVIAKVAGIAAREVEGVYALGGGAARAFGALRDAIGSTDHGQGVHVEVGETQVAADITIAVEYPVPMQQVADRVRAAVGHAITELVGLQVAEINVAINDVHIPGDDKDAPAEESRVQ